MISIPLKPGIGQRYICILCGTNVGVNIFGSLMTDTYTCVAETHKLMSNVSFRKPLGFIFFSVKRRGLG